VGTSTRPHSRKTPRWLSQMELPSMSTMNSISQTSRQSRRPVDAYATMFMITLRYHVALDDGLDNVIVVDGVPVIDKSKLEKLLAKISKEFTKKGAALKPENTFVPWDNASGKSKGCANTILRIGNVANRPPPATYSSMQAARTQQHLRSAPCMVILSIQSIPSLSTDSPILNNMRTWRKHISNRR